MTRRFWLALVILVGSGWTARAAEQAPAKNIDLVICLDVSGSMEGLLAAAKGRLWDVVNDLAKIQPTPNLRVALYSYGSKSYEAKAGWVRKEVDLTSDLDAIYQKLNALAIVYAGPGNSNEYVARVCRDAIEKQSWADDKDALRVIFVCGNEPVNQDPDVDLKTVADKAVAKNIFINSIFCGPANDPDAPGWRDFASKAKGTFASIDTNRQPVVIHTPFDKELAELSSKLSQTYIAYGALGKERAANQLAQDQNAAKAPGAAAARAESKATGLYRNEAWDLVDRLKNDAKFDVKKVPVEELCDEMKKMTPAEREAHIKKKLAEREAMQKQIAELSEKRQSYIKEEQRKTPSTTAGALDAALRKALREQAGTKGIKIAE